MAGRMPDFLVVGAPKAGTSSLYQALKRHPQIFMSANKEPHFFAFEGEMPKFSGPRDDEAWLSQKSVVTLAEYQSLFEKAKPEQICGEASTMYLYLPSSCDRIHHYVPNAKIVIFLRHPIDRAFSHYKHMRRDGREWEKGFLSALEKEATRIEEGWAPAWHYQQVGRYSEQVKLYLDRFGPEQVRIYLYDEFVRSPADIYRDLLTFLDVDPEFAVDTAQRYNQTEMVVRSRRLHDFFARRKGVKSMVKQMIPEFVRKPVADRVYRQKVSAIAPLTSGQRAELTRGMEAEILRLQDVIGKDLSGWLGV